MTRNHYESSMSRSMFERKKISDRRVIPWVSGALTQNRFFLEPTTVRAAKLHEIATRRAQNKTKNHFHFHVPWSFKDVKCVLILKCFQEEAHKNERANTRLIDV